MFSGFCMGTADVVPGVSGGTMAVALGILSSAVGGDHVESIDRPCLAWRRLRIKDVFARVHWRFLVSLLFGVALGVGVMVKIVKLPTMVVASSPHRTVVYAAFFGMVLASAMLLVRRVSSWTPVRAIAVAVGNLARPADRDASSGGDARQSVVYLHVWKHRHLRHASSGDQRIVHSVDLAQVRLQSSAR